MNNFLLLFSQTYQNVAQLVTVSYFSQVPARARHFLIETADDTAVDEEASSLKRNEPDREVGSLNRQAPPLQQAPAGEGAGAATGAPPVGCGGAGAGGAGAGGAECDIGRAGAGGAGARAMKKNWGNEYDSYESFERVVNLLKSGENGGENGHMVRQKKFLLSILLERY